MSPPTTQNSIVFIKRKFGLFKTKISSDKKSFGKLRFLRGAVHRRTIFKKKQKYLKHHRAFSKKRFNKLYYNKGRRLLMQYKPIKKYLIQKYITKRLTKFIKQPGTHLLHYMSLSSALLKVSLFISLLDATQFIKQFGIVVNDAINYDPNSQIFPGFRFSLPITIKSYKFFFLKKKLLVKGLKRIKFYKYRTKYFLSKRTYQ